MKTAATLVALSAAVVLADPQHQHGLPEGTKIDCSKPNANFCMGGDIILRCDGSSVGTKGRCSDNVSGYPPAGGSATCMESDKMAGDAACVKNCVVYAEPSYTLAADKCEPSVIPEGLKDTPTADAGTTGIVTIPEGTGAWSSEPTVFTYPIDTTASSLISVIIDPIPSEYLTSSGTGNMPQPTNTSSEGGGSQTTPVVQPTGAAPANQAMGGLAIAGIVAAYLV